MSLPDGRMEESLSQHRSYLLRQYSIKGKKVVHVGDCYQSRASSNNSINSILSLGSENQFLTVTSLRDYSGATASSPVSLRDQASASEEVSRRTGPV